MLEAVMFDMDGLTIDTEKYYKRCWIAAAKEAGFEMKKDDYLKLRSCAKEFAEPMLKKRFGDGFDYDKIREKRRELVEEAVKKEGIDKKPYVSELISYLKSKGIRCILVTATCEERARRFLKIAGLEDAFEELICADMVKHGKPASDIYKYACEKAGVKPEDCLALEDSPNGVKSAHGAGLKVIMVSDLSTADEDTKKLIVRETKDLGEVMNFIKLESFQTVG